LIYASAVVDFVTGQQGQGIAGMGLRFTTVDDGTKRFLESVVAAMPHAASAEPPVPKGVGPPDRTPPAPPPPPPSTGAPVPRVAAAAPAALVPTAPAFEEPTEPPK